MKYFIDDDNIPQECSIICAKTHTHYRNLTDLIQAVKKNEETKKKETHRYGSHIVMKETNKRYLITVPKNVTQEELDEALFHLEYIRKIKHSQNSPIKLDDSDKEYNLYYFYESSNETLGLGWNTDIFPNVTWVEDIYKKHKEEND